MASWENDQRKHLVRIMRPLHAVAIENGVGVGTPDINYRDGWIECKSVDQPARADTVVRVDHFTAHQRLFHRMRRQAGGVSLVCVKVGTMWLLMDGQVAAEVLGRVNIERLVERSVATWNHKPQRKEFLDCLKRICDRARG